MLAGTLYGETALPKAWLTALDPPIRQACEAQARALVRLSAGTHIANAQTI
jgi:hypothetical protein